MIDLFLPQQSGPRAASPGIFSDFWYSMIGQKTKAGVKVSEDSALTHSAVACATRIISETEAQLPLKTYYRLDGGGKREAPDELLYDLFQVEPNPHMGAMPFRESSTAQQMNWGNSYSEIVEERGRIDLWPIHPSRVQKPYVENGRLKYAVRNNNGPDTILDQSEMLHIPGVLSDDGITGKGIISLARESIGGVIATDRHGHSFFGNGARPGGVLTHPTRLEKDARENLRREWKMVHGGPDKASDIAVLYEGVTYTPISIPNNDAQFLETRTFNITEIARWYRVPPYMLADLTKATYSNVEFMGIEFVIYTMLPWLRRWEDAINRQLIPRERRKEIFVEHNVAALLRGDIKSRYEAYKTGLIHGWLTINDILRMENMNPIGDEGDERFFQRNMTTVERLIAGTESGGATAAVVKQMSLNQEEVLRKLSKISGVAMQGETANVPAAVPAIESKSVSECEGVTSTSKMLAEVSIKEIATRLVAKEINELRRAFKSGDKFPIKCNIFYTKHSKTCREAINKVMESLAESTLEFNSLGVQEWVSAGKEEAGKAYTEIGDLSNMFEDWKSHRAEDLVRRILGTEKTE